MLKKHLQWCYDDKNDFVSWTSSLLYALQRAIYAIKNGDTDVHICMVDTWKMSEQTFYHAETLLKLYKIPDEGPRLVHRYYAAEFLTTGQLTLSQGHNSDEVPFVSLANSGLYDLVPHLSRYDTPGKSGHLFHAVSNMRRENFISATPISPKDVQLATLLAQKMCLSFVIPFFTNLLSLQKRNSDDEQFMAGIEALLSKWTPETIRKLAASNWRRTRSKWKPLLNEGRFCAQICGG
jgi:hypothetical protein